MVDMATIFEIPDDVVFFILGYITPLNFVSISKTCSHFHGLLDSTTHAHCPINRYWQQQCYELWALIKKNDYTHYNYKCLYRLLFDFIISTKKSHVDDKLRNRVLKREITVDTMKHILPAIVKQDNLEMFQIYTCNMNDIDIKQDCAQLEQPCSSILYAAIRSDAKKIVKYLLAPINSKYNFSKMDINKLEETFGYIDVTPLTLAITRKNVEMVSLLINHPNMTKKVINETDEFGLPPLHSICCDSSKNDNKCFEMAQILINDERTDLNGVIHDGSTALILATISQPKIAQLLIENDKVDVNIQSLTANTALHAVVRGYYKQQDIYNQLIKQLLLRKDCNKHIRNIKGETALDLAKKLNHSNVIDMLTNVDKL